jgi:hypothetical protein
MQSLSLLVTASWRLLQACAQPNNEGYSSSKAMKVRL